MQFVVVFFILDVLDFSKSLHVFFLPFAVFAQNVRSKEMNSNEELNSYVCMTQDPTDSFLTVRVHLSLTEWFVCSENSKKK